MKQFKRFVRIILNALSFSYETSVAPFLAFKLSFLFWPAYKLCRSKNCCFLINISEGVGHVISEVDNFLRKKFLEEIDVNKKYILIRKSAHLSRDFIPLYKNLFHFAISSSFLYYLTLPLIMRYPSITLDCGLSRSKWQLIENSETSTWPKITTKQQNTQEWSDYYQRFNKTEQFFPLMEFTGDDPALDNFINFKNDKIAIVHIKSNIINCTADKTDPKTYIPAIEFLKSLGYTLVFAGREKYPELFKDYGVINYAESNLRSFKNDIRLFSKADVAILAGSGIAFLAACYNVDLLYLNSWHIFRPLVGARSIFVPALVENLDGTPVKFLDQWNLYIHPQETEAEQFPFKTFRGRNATADEILIACQELFQLKEKDEGLTVLQKQLYKLSAAGLQGSRVSEFFLQRHKHLF